MRSGSANCRPGSSSTSIEEVSATGIDARTVYANGATRLCRPGHRQRPADEVKLAQGFEEQAAPL